MDDSKAVMDEFLRRMRELQTSDDIQEAHELADDILCEALNYFGVEELVDEWKKLDKWCA